MTAVQLSMFPSPQELVCANHYTKTWPSGKSHIFEYQEAVVVFSIPANFMTSRWLGCEQGRVWELTRLWAPDGHHKNLLTKAISVAISSFHKLGLADAVISYADPNAGHLGGVYRAASWVYLGQSEEVRAYRGPDGQITPRRKFHSGTSFLRKAEIIATGYSELSLPGKFRFARGLTRQGKRAIRLKAKLLASEAGR